MPIQKVEVAMGSAAAAAVVVEDMARLFAALLLVVDGQLMGFSTNVVSRGR